LTTRRYVLIILSVILTLCSCLFTPKSNIVKPEFVYPVSIIKDIYIDDAFSFGEEEDIRKALTAKKNLINLFLFGG